MEILFEQMRLRHDVRRGNVDDQASKWAKLEFELTRSRVLERKRNALAKVRSRRITKHTSSINLWRTRAQWLASAEGLHQALPEFGPEMDPHDYSD